MISVTLLSDPACPWAYSENPALRVLEWRYGSQLAWRLVLVGLSEDTARYEANGYTPLRMARGHISFRDRYGMPFAGMVKPRLAASSRACRAVIAARRAWPGSEWRVFRALQLANFTSPLLFDDDAQMREVLGRVPGIDADELVAAIDDPQVRAEYEQDKALTRTAAGSATELQGKAGNSDGAVRYTAPSLIFETEDRRRLEAGGFQPVEAYDVIVANLDPTLERREAPEDPAALLAFFPLGLVTQEVAVLMTRGNDAPDRGAAEAALLTLLADGRARREPLGDDALWLAGPEQAAERERARGEIVPTIA
jgi:protein-disulfide isomerase-like protein with CxxC motif